MERITYNGVTVTATDRRPSTRDDKKYMRYVRRGDDTRLVHWGQPGEDMERDNEDAREAFNSRHSCSEKRDPFTPGFWACWHWQPSAKSVDLSPMRDIAAALWPDRVKRAAKSANLYAIGEMLEGEDRALYERTYTRVMDLTGDPVKAALAADGALRAARFGLAVKARKDEDGAIVGGWGILFGDPDHLDLDRTWFGPHTDFFLDDYANAPLWWEHADDERVKSFKLGNRIKSEVYPDYGIWIEHRIDPSLPAFDILDYDDVLRQIEVGELAYSSDSLNHHVVGGYNEKSGELAIWPLAGFSLVSRPAEPRLGPVIAQKLRE